MYLFKKISRHSQKYCALFVAKNRTTPTIKMTDGNVYKHDTCTCCMLKRISILIYTTLNLVSNYILCRVWQTFEYSADFITATINCYAESLST